MRNLTSKGAFKRFGKDIILKIISLLRSPREVLNLSQTSKAFHSLIAGYDLLWEKFIAPEFRWILVIPFLSFFTCNSYNSPTATKAF